MAVGIAYFEDGHTEEINYYRGPIGDSINFHTSSGWYRYVEYIHELESGYLVKRHAFYELATDGECWVIGEKATDIDRIELIL